MQQDTTDLSRPIRIGFLLLPQFSMMALASASEPFRAANRLTGQSLYEYFSISENGGIIKSSSDFELNTHALEDISGLDRIFVVASLDIETLYPAKMIRYLQKFVTSGKPVGALSTGTFILARAGVLHGKRCTLHWESLPEFQEEFPDIEATRELYVRDGTRWTCAGGTAAIDLMLAQISGDHNAALAAQIADQFLHSRIRGPEESQRMAIQWRYDIHDKRITAAIAFMESNYANVVGIEDIAAKCHLSQRQLERLWHQNFGKTPQRFYLELRLAEARRRLRESTDSIATIAFQCGFVSPSHLGSAYKKLWGNSPGEERRKALNKS